MNEQINQLHQMLKRADKILEQRPEFQHYRKFQAVNEALNKALDEFLEFATKDEENSRSDKPEVAASHE